MSDLNKNRCPACGADITLDFKQVNSLFSLWVDEPKVNTGAKVLTSRLIKTFGYDAVREAFIQSSVDNKRMTLAYVRGILLKKHQQKAIQQSLAEAEDKKRELNLINSIPGEE